MDKLRLYPKLPVYIEEDHHEVVPHIHRAIASRHLPMSGLTFVHFDSHPDLLIPLNMPADHVFDKQELYNSLSIENWILPLVYAGHLSDIYWLRPPWAQQLPFGQSTFGVGRCKDTGKLRMTCPDPYFLTEALYASELSLLDTKYTTLHVITITPGDWDHCNSSTSKLNSDPEVGTVNAKRKCCSEDDEESNSCSKTVNHNDYSETKMRKFEHGQNPENTNCFRQTPENANCHKVESDSISQTLSPEPVKCGDKSKELPGAWKWLEELRDKVQNKPYILDIDLDFFSTKDPFRNDCTPEHTALLRELFGYQLPKDHSTQALLEFTAARQAQLEELEKAFETLQQDPSKIPHIQQPHRQATFEKLINSVRAEHGIADTVDFSRFFLAGCTMDDTELPHHVSSPAQISQLMGSCHYVLETLPAPTIITVARSSEDDYCPKDQVEAIQNATLEVLHKVYQDVDVKRMYELKLAAKEPSGS